MYLAINLVSFLLSLYPRFSVSKPSIAFDLFSLQHIPLNKNLASKNKEFERILQPS